MGKNSPNPAPELSTSKTEAVKQVTEEPADVGCNQRLIGWARRAWLFFTCPSVFGAGSAAVAGGRPSPVGNAPFGFGIERATFFFLTFDLNPVGLAGGV